jgi:hypothetical protein
MELAGVARYRELSDSFGPLRLFGPAGCFVRTGDDAIARIFMVRRSNFSCSFTLLLLNYLLFSRRREMMGGRRPTQRTHRREERASNHISPELSSCSL